ncbi:hypothetical protein ACI2JA_01750 [Alkalihalobacillus sp. NPDC078783]
MLDIFLISLAFPLALLLVTLIYRKITFYSMFFLICIGIYFLGVILWYFFVVSYGGDNTVFIFPDEKTYMYGDSTGFFGSIVKMIVSVVSLVGFRFLSVFCYSFGLLWLTTELLQSYIEKDQKINMFKFSFICIIAALGSYWSFFILKEGMTILCVSVYLISYKRKNLVLKVFAILMTILVRPEIAIAIILAEFIFFMWKRSKKLLFTLFFVGVFTIIYYFNSADSESLKLSFVSRRYGESEKIYDNEAIRTARLGFLPFITSYTYLETILGNFLRSLVPLYQSTSPISTPLTLINLIGSILLLVKFKIRKDVPTIFGIIILVLLLASVSVARYLTVIIIPLTIFLLLDNHKKKIN